MPIKSLQLTQQNQLGFSLLEVLIALLVLSIGLLGLAGLQTFGLKFNHQSYQRTQAVFLADDMADRMRTNRSAVIATNYLLTKTGTYTTSFNCISSACSAAADMADWDKAQWISNINRTLANGQGQITKVVGSTEQLYDILVQWTEGDLNLSHVIRVQLPD